MYFASLIFCNDSNKGVQHGGFASSAKEAAYDQNLPAWMPYDKASWGASVSVVEYTE
jgi:hypothetical protein